MHSISLHVGVAIIDSKSRYSSSFVGLSCPHKLIFLFPWNRAKSLVEARKRPRA
jgi:hypothetical protein